VAKAPDPACIYVLAGTNGAGKSSLGGAVIRAKGADYFNPDGATRRIRSVRPHRSVRDARIGA
jgi:predicted ABC-type ATPase